MTLPRFDRISDYARYWAEQAPGREALVSEHVRWPYAELANRVDQCAKALLRAGVQRGDRVATLAPPHPDYFVTFLAASSIGAIWLGLNPRYTLTELHYVIDDAEPCLILARSTIADRDFRDELASIGRECPFVRRMVILGGDPVPRGTEIYSGFVAGAADVSDTELEAARRLVEPGDAALLVYTSGTTGRPKGAMLPHRGLVQCSLVQATKWVATPLRILNNLPINHIGCVGDISCYALVSGGTTVFMEKFDPEGILRTIEREHLTSWGQVPAMFALTLSGEAERRRGGGRPYDLSSLQMIVWSGSAAPSDLIVALGKICPNLSSSYGLTESVGSMTYAIETDDMEVLANTIGWPAPEYEFRLAKEDGSEATVGEPGEIQVRGDFMMLGYWKLPEATTEAIDPEGWLHTGDLAVRRPDGAITLVGRLKEMFKSGGYNVYPREVEIALESHPAVQLAAVIGVPDEVYAEVGHAFVLVPEGSPVTEEELREHCRTRLANYKVPKRFTIAAELPLLPIGKIDKQALKRAVSGQQ